VGSKLKQTRLVSKVLHVPNRHCNPTDHFAVAKKDVPRDDLKQIVGIIHSHPPLLKLPSERDIHQCRPHWLSAIVTTKGWVWYTRRGVVAVHERTPRLE